MKVIGIGDLVLDYYYKDGELLGVNGGKTMSNIIFNLSYLGIPTSIYGTCGKDIQGDICIDSLKRVGTDIYNIERKNVSTKVLHVSINNDNQFTKRRCPVCNEKKWYENNDINVFNKIDVNDIVVIDGFEYNDMIKDLKTIKIMIDIGYYQKFDQLPNHKLLEFFDTNFEIINMNERVEEYLLSRFNIEPWKLLKAKLFVITRGKKGADFIFNEIIYSKKLTKISNEIDTNGAGDMFFSVIISEYIKNGFVVNNEFIDKLFEKSNNLTGKVVSCIGSRSYFQPLYEVEKIKSKCTCEDIVIKNKK